MEHLILVASGLAVGSSLLTSSLHHFWLRKNLCDLLSHKKLVEQVQQLHAKLNEFAEKAKAEANTALKCSFCGLHVVRYSQREDSKICCANCERRGL